jgi:hypothetical protein
VTSLAHRSSTNLQRKSKCKTQGQLLYFSQVSLSRNALVQNPRDKRKSGCCVSLKPRSTLRSSAKPEGKTQVQLLCFPQVSLSRNALVQNPRDKRKSGCCVSLKPRSTLRSSAKPEALGKTQVQLLFPSSLALAQRSSAKPEGKTQEQLLYSLKFRSRAAPIDALPRQSSLRSRRRPTAKRVGETRKPCMGEARKGGCPPRNCTPTLRGAGREVVSREAVTAHQQR